MDIFHIVLFVSIILGILLVIFSLFLFSFDSKNNSPNYFEMANTMKYLDSSINEIDKTMEELNETSKYIFDELNEKYNELLFLYSLIDEKKKEVSNSYNTTQETPKQSKNDQSKTLPNENKTAQTKKIMDMNNQGLSVSNIAKKLNIGQGEVKLILELEKSR